MQKFSLSKRSFSGAAVNGKAACSLVSPVHHRVRIDKSKLSPRFPELKLSKNDIRSPAYNPVSTYQDRVHEHYLKTLQSDLLLINYSHDAKTELGLKQRAWDGSSPYHINRPPRKPQGSLNQFPDMHPIKWHNIPEITGVVLNCYVREAKENRLLAISAALQLQQITGCKPHAIYSKSDVPSWKLRKGNQMGAKIELKGRPMSQFLSTLTEIVMPRIREYQGISNRAGNGLGSLSFGLTSEDVKFFPEIDSNQDLWPKTFGFHVNINTSAQTDVQARTLISGFQLPFHGAEKKRS